MDSLAHGQVIPRLNFSIHVPDMDTRPSRPINRPLPEIPPYAFPRTQHHTDTDTNNNTHKTSTQHITQQSHKQITNISYRNGHVDAMQLTDCVSCGLYIYVCVRVCVVATTPIKNAQLLNPNPQL